MNAPVEQLSLCSGLGEKKIKRLHQVFHQPLRRDMHPKVDLSESEDKTTGSVELTEALSESRDNPIGE